MWLFYEMRFADASDVPRGSVSACEPVRAAAGGILGAGPMTDRRRIAPVAVLTLFGILSLTSVLTRPQVASYRGPDVLQIFGSGMCFGAAIVRLVTVIAERRSR